MAISGTGTQADPWIITTYAELVEKAATASECYIKVGNDINIADEFPNGDAPKLYLTHAFIDGDGKIITNWYNTENKPMIECSGTSSSSYIKNPHIENLTIRNILATHPSSYFITTHYGTSDGIFMFYNCKFAGKCMGGFSKQADTGGNNDNFQRCSFNIDCGASSFSYRSRFRSCKIKTKTSNDSLFLYNDANQVIRDSYIIAEMTSDSATVKFNDTSTDYALNNCVIDITTNAVLTKIGKAVTTYPISIINLAHAPNATEYAGNVAGVSGENWHNIAYLQSIGFLCVENPPNEVQNSEGGE